MCDSITHHCAQLEIIILDVYTTPYYTTLLVTVLRCVCVTSVAVVDE